MEQDGDVMDLWSFMGRCSKPREQGPARLTHCALALVLGHTGHHYVDHTVPPEPPPLY